MPEDDDERERVREHYDNAGKAGDALDKLDEINEDVIEDTRTKEDLEEGKDAIKRVREAEADRGYTGEEE